MKKILETQTPAKISGQLKLYQPNHSRDDHLGILEYSLQVPFDLIKALKSQKRKLTASSFLPPTIDDKSMYNELIIQIHRCLNIDKLARTSKALPSVYVVYQIYDLPPHLTNVVNNNSNPVFDDVKSYFLPTGSALHQYLKTHELVVYIVEELKDKTGKHKTLGSVKLPLFVLARNQKLQGTFTINNYDDEITEATVDVSIHWKYSYTFNDENMKLGDPVPVEFPKIKPREEKKEDKLDDKKIVETAPIADEITKQNSPEIKKPTLFDTSSDESSVDGTVIENIPSKDNESSSDDTYVVDDEDIESIQEKPENNDGESSEKEDSSPTELPQEGIRHEVGTDDHQPRPESSPVEEDKSKKIIGEEPTAFSDSEIEEIKTLKGLKEELEKLDRESTSSEEDFKTDESDNEIDKDTTPRVPDKADILPPKPPPRRLSKTRGVDFKEPLHSSIPREFIVCL